MRSFGEILTSLREERGIYQKELAAILKVSVGTVSNYENNIHFPDQDALLQLADYFGVSRPSLARELAHMQDDGLIKTDRKLVHILRKEDMMQLIQ